MPLTVSIVNQFDDVHPFSFELPVEHVSTPSRPRRSESLFEPAGRSGSRPLVP
jgi:hypothetical protein